MKKMLEGIAIGCGRFINVTDPRLAKETQRFTIFVKLGNEIIQTQFTPSMPRLNSFLVIWAHDIDKNQEFIEIRLHHQNSDPLLCILSHLDQVEIDEKSAITDTTGKLIQSLFAKRAHLQLVDLLYRHSLMLETGLNAKNQNSMIALELMSMSLSVLSMSNPLIYKNIFTWLKSLAVLPKKMWPIGSIWGQYEYLQGNIKLAYEHFMECSQSTSLSWLPTWCMGITGLTAPNSASNSASQLQSQFVFDIFVLGEKVKYQNFGFVVGVDDIYFKTYGQIFLESLEQNCRSSAAFVAVINPSPATISTLENIRNNATYPRVAFFVLSMPNIKDLTTRDQKGVYTLIRFFLAETVFSIFSGDLVIVEGDAYVVTDELLHTLKNQNFDVGLLIRRECARPWLWITAPMVYLRNTEFALTFATTLCNALRSAIHSKHKENSGYIHLWGLDQAALVSTYDQTRSSGSSIRFANIISYVDKILIQAQSSGSKKTFQKNMRIRLEKLTGMHDF